MLLSKLLLLLVFTRWYSKALLLPSTCWSYQGTRGKLPLLLLPAPLLLLLVPALAGTALALAA